jgi:Na+/H+ antiporter NhaD/arsenite permease-like protein
VAASNALAAPIPPGDRLTVSGAVKNLMGKGIKEVEVEVLVNGQHVKPQDKDEEIATGKSGSFLAEFILPAGTLPHAKVELKGFKPSWKPLAAGALQVMAAGADQAGNRLFQATQISILYRTITPAFWIATIILVLVYIFIAGEFMHRTLAALLGAALILFVSYTIGTFDKNYLILTFEDAMSAIDMNVIFLLMAMMIIVGVLKKTGIFQWLAYKSYAAARGNVFILGGILMVVTAVCSVFLDNVTTMLLMIPVTIEIAVTLKINPLAFLMPEVFASNVGGTATLIGDPPNILIGSYAKLSFMDFVGNLTLICLICLVVTVIFYLYWYKKDYLKAEVKDVNRTIALFIVIAGAEETGLIQIIAEWVKNVSGGNLTAAVIIVLWVSAIASACIDNIPFTATMLPIIAFLNQTIPGAESGVLWWSLAQGACLGGNGTMIGASANVVTVGLAEKAGYHISFLYYLKVCWWPMIISVTLSMFYLLLAY